MDKSRVATPLNRLVGQGHLPIAGDPDRPSALTQTAPRCRLGAAPSPADDAPPVLLGIDVDGTDSPDRRPPADAVLAAYLHDPPPTAAYLPDRTAGEGPERGGSWRSADLLVLAAAGVWARTLAVGPRPPTGLEPPGDPAAWS